MSSFRLPRLLRRAFAVLLVAVRAALVVIACAFWCPPAFGQAQGDVEAPATPTAPASSSNHASCQSDAAPAAEASALGDTSVSKRASQRVDAAAPVTYRLANGLEVVLVRDARVRRVAVAVGYRVGHADDPDGYHGLAHLVEHVMFEGMSSALGAEYMERLERVGATHINGVTTLDRTYFAQELPSDSLELGLWLEASRMAYLLTWVTPNILERARAAVLAEWNTSRGPANVLAPHEAEALFPAGHPYRHAFDRPEDLEQVTLRDAQWFFQRWYAPDNATLVVLGNFDVDAAREKISRLFGPVRGTTPTPPRVRHAPVVLSGIHTLEIGFRVRNSVESLAWSVPTGTGIEIDEEDAALDVLCMHLRRAIAGLDGGSEVLAVSASYQEHQLANVVRLSWTLPLHADAASVREHVAREISRVREELLTPEELSRARTPWRQLFLFGREGVVSRAVSLLIAPLTYDERAARYARVDAEAVRAAARRFLDPERVVHMIARSDGFVPVDGKVQRRTLVPARTAARSAEP